MRHFISVDQLTPEEIFGVIETAESFRHKNLQLNDQLFAANLFFESSTRTKMSFVVAQRKLGFEVLDFHEASSSTSKGETLYDTAKTFEAIGANLLVVRHQDDDWFEALAENITIPMINGGAGKVEHPTQCMLDLLTIYQEYGTLKDLNVVIAGDIKHSRVARSNVNALKKMGANVFLCAAPGFEDMSIKVPYITIDRAVKISDVMMLLRIQHERHAEHMDPTENYLYNYGLTKEREKRMKENAIILHPAPINRGVEIDTDLVECDRSRIFKQMSNGVYVRMAVMKLLLQEWGIIHENSAEENENVITYQRTKTV